MAKMTTESTESLAPDPDLEDDGFVVDEISEEEQEARRAELVAKVAKVVAEPQKKQPGNDDRSAAEGKVETPDELSQAMKDRATEAGIPEGLVPRLLENGLLEETLAAFDRKLIEQAKTGSKQDGKPDEKGKAKPDSDGGEIGLDPDEFDERLVKAFSALQAKIDGLAKSEGGGDRFQKWFDGEVAKLKNEKLFSDAKNRELLRDGYERICEVRGVKPDECHDDLLRRAYPAMFQDEVFKAAQRETVQRLRDAQGRFILPTKASGKPPGKRQLSEGERHDALISKVKTLLNR
jgi:hypothetical protein